MSLEHGQKSKIVGVTDLLYLFPHASHTMRQEIFPFPPRQPLVDDKHCVICGRVAHCGTNTKNSTAGLLIVKWIQLLLVFSWGFQPPQRVINLDPAS